MSIRTYKFKLYTTKKLKKLNQIINISGIIYNHCIALHKRYYRLYGKSLNKYQLQKHITKLKKTEKHAFWRTVPSQSIQDITDRIESSRQKFFKKQGSLPSFQKVLKYKSYTLKQSGYKIEGNVISLNGYKFKFWKSKKIDEQIKTITIKRDNLGDFYICVAVKIEAEEKVTSGKIVGIDFGLKTFLTLSDGQIIDSPLYHLQSLKKLKKLNQKLAKKKKGSNNRKKAKNKLAKFHIKIANQRNDYLHKLSSQMAAKYDTIILEDLNINAMKKLWGRKVSDLGFSNFVTMLEYKMKIVKIDRFYPSSKTCSCCGFINKDINSDLTGLSNRLFICFNCDFKMDRDLNASINIERVGTSTLRIEDVRATSVA